jgi:hypothetical protein
MPPKGERGGQILLADSTILHDPVRRYGQLGELLEKSRVDEMRGTPSRCQTTPSRSTMKVITPLAP